MCRHRPSVVPAATRRALLACAAALALVVATLAALPGAAQAAGSLPCDIYAAGGTPCVAAHSTVRALYSSYNRPLYQLTRASDGATHDVGLLATGGYVNAWDHDAFCNSTTCTITKIYDQTGRHNDLTPSPAGTAGGADSPADATKRSLLSTVIYSVLICWTGFAGG